MKNMKRLVAIGILMFVAVAHGATDGQSSASEKGGVSSRLNHQFGITVGLMDPYPSLLGYSAHYNMTDMLRASLGYGSGLLMSSIGAGLTAMVPGWNFTPTGGLHVSSVSGQKDVTLQGFEGSGTALYASAGFDWQTHGGFNIQSGMTLPLGKGASSFYASLGWFFL